MIFETWKEQNLFTRYEEAIHRCRHNLKEIEDDLALADSVLNFLVKSAYEQSHGHHHTVTLGK